MDVVAIILFLVLPLLLLVFGFAAGRFTERRHLRRLDALEADLRHIRRTDIEIEASKLGVEPGGCVLVVGSVVMAADYFKTFSAGLRYLIGGEVRGYERVLTRARREAICRMLHEARRMNAHAVINVRLETSSIGNLANNPSAMVEVIAYGTAVLPKTG